jgi:hypothetical protein
MQAETQPAPTPKWMIWIGWLIGVVPVLFLVFSGVMKLLKPPFLVEGFTTHNGFDESVILPLGIVELACTLVYLIPRSAVLGAILLTGYLGGAVATHLRVGEAALIFPVVLGVLVWLGLYLRDYRLRALLPLRSKVPQLPTAPRDDAYGA